jgi:hypothetical protein
MLLSSTFTPKGASTPLRTEMFRSQRSEPLCALLSLTPK